MSAGLIPENSTSINAKLCVIGVVFGAISGRFDPAAADVAADADRGGSGRSTDDRFRPDIRFMSDQLKRRHGQLLFVAVVYVVFIVFAIVFVVFIIIIVS